MRQNAFQIAIVVDEPTRRFLTNPWHAWNIIRFITHQPLEVWQALWGEAIASRCLLLVVLGHLRNAALGNFYLYMIVDQLQCVHITSINNCINTLLRSLDSKSSQNIVRLVTILLVNLNAKRLD